MDWLVHIDNDGRIDGKKPKYLQDTELDIETGEYIDVERPNFTELDEELGWFEWPFDEPIPDGFWEYGIIDGKLVHVGQRPPTPEEQRASDVKEAIDDLPEIQEGLIEVAGMSADHETSISDLEDAIIELAALIGGDSNG